MNCPNCHAPYDGDVRFCPECGHPLSNAHYTQISGKTEPQKYRTRKIRKFLLVLFLLCLITGIGAPIGYHFYLSAIKKSCRKATVKIFSMAHDMDFSSIDPAYLPEELQENPDIRALIQEKLTDTLSEEDFGSLQTYIGEYLDADTICDDIISSASYEILSVDADYHSCRVTVRTENTDYSKLTDAVYEEVYQEMTDTDNLWKAIGSFFSSIIGVDEKEESEETDYSEKISRLYQEAKANTPAVSETGVLEFGIKNGSWTLTDLDENLFYCYYGISSFLEEFPKN